MANIQPGWMVVVVGGATRDGVARGKGEGERRSLILYAKSWETFDIACFAGQRLSSQGESVLSGPCVSPVAPCP